VALSLVALIAAGGIAFDYARMASMNTELQSAADHAALAGATQLDGRAGACDRARAAAVGMVSNQTLMANDGNGLAVTITQGSGCAASSSDGVRLYQDITHTTAATTDANAKFVMVVVDSRTANFALTPIVGALSSTMSATAFAGLNQAICKVPPLMLCNPAESTDPDFTVANYIGDGMRLISDNSNASGGTYAPGNFGFLASGLDTTGVNGAKVLREVLGQSTVPGNCVTGNGVTTDPGNMITVRDALNTRFGIYEGGSLNNPCGNGGSGCPPSANIRQDLVLSGNGASNNDLGFLTSGKGNPKGWLEAANPYPGSAKVGTTPKALTDSDITGSPAIAPMGYPEDICHAFSEAGSCTNGRIGDGVWDRYAYFRSNSASYPEITNAATFTSYMNTWFKTTTPTRYQVYQWEMARASTRLKSQSAGSYTAHSNPTDLKGEPTAITPGANAADRRVLTAAVINCAAEGVKGKTVNVQVQKWIDLFLVQPSEVRSVGTPSTNSDVYVEVIGETDNATNSGAVQLIEKSVPYLIE
jgi:hypothetical protein